MGLFDDYSPSVPGLKKHDGSMIVESGRLEQIMEVLALIRHEMSALKNSPASEVSRVVEALAQIGGAIREVTSARSNPPPVELAPLLSEISEIKVLLSELPQPQQESQQDRPAPSRWEFTIDRDENNLITNVTATPVYEGGTGDGLGS